MKALSLFERDDWAIRVLTEEDDVWFVAADVARALGYRDAERMTRRLSMSDRGTRSVGTPGGPQQMSVISEPGLYLAVFASQVDRADDFKDWVAREVLPAIRRTGSYSLGSVPALPQDYPSALRELAETVERESALKLELEQAAPKVAAHDLLCESDGAMSMNEVAHLLNIGEVTLFKRLRAARILQSSKDSWNSPFRSYDHHFNVITTVFVDAAGKSHPRKKTLVRPSGLSFIAGRLGLVESAGPVLELVTTG